MKRELEHAEARVVPDFAVWKRGTHLIEDPASCADHELPDAASTVEHARGVLGREPLVVVVVPDEEKVRAVVVEGAVERKERVDSWSVLP
jgi:hypothetical protein